MRYIKLALGSKNADAKVAQGNAIKTALTGNPNFTNLNPSLVTVTSVINDLAAKKIAKDNAQEAAKAATEALYPAEKTYDVTITQLAACCEGQVLGDVVKLEGAGFDMRKTPAPIGNLPQVRSVRLTSNTYEGRLFARWEPVYGAKSYEAQLSTDPAVDANWRSLKPCTTSSMTIEDLESGVKMWLRVRAVASRTEGPWSQLASKVVP